MKNTLQYRYKVIGHSENDYVFGINIHDARIKAKNKCAFPVQKIIPAISEYDEYTPKIDRKESLK